MDAMKRALVKGFALCALNGLMATHVQAQLIEGCETYQNGETFEVNQPGPVHLGPASTVVEVGDRYIVSVTPGTAKNVAWRIAGPLGTGSTLVRGGVAGTKINYVVQRSGVGILPYIETIDGTATMQVRCIPGNASATSFRQSYDGVGHALLVPYYTAQPGYATLLNVVNTDPRYGKAVKVRFRGASNADDVFNFTLFLSPGDVWAAEVSQDPVSGLARLSTPDSSCTLFTQRDQVTPAPNNRAFSTARLDPAANLANETREGYVELLTMANLLPGTAVYNATTPVNGVLPAPCSNMDGVISALQPLLSEEGIANAELALPTAGLQGTWSIFNVAEASSWSGKATAIAAVVQEEGWGVGMLATGRMVMSPQVNGRTPMGAVTRLTSDPLLNSGSVIWNQADLPDLSTPYLVDVKPEQQTTLLSNLLAKYAVRNEYFTDVRVDAQTDWVFMEPMRRYSVALNYKTGLPETWYGNANYYYGNTRVGGKAGGRRICIPIASYTAWNRAGQSRTQTVSAFPPSVLTANLDGLCGAVQVVSINADNLYAPSALSATVSRKNLITEFDDGWLDVSIDGQLWRGVPVLGAAFAKATNTNVGEGVSGNFGLTWEHSYSRRNVIP